MARNSQMNSNAAFSQSLIRSPTSATKHPAFGQAAIQADKQIDQPARQTDSQREAGSEVNLEAPF